MKYIGYTQKPGWLIIKEALEIKNKKIKELGGVINMKEIKSQTNLIGLEIGEKVYYYTKDIYGIVTEISSRLRVEFKDGDDHTIVRSFTIDGCEVDSPNGNPVLFFEKPRINVRKRKINILDYLKENFEPYDLQSTRTPYALYYTPSCIDKTRQYLSVEPYELTEDRVVGVVLLGSKKGSIYDLQKSINEELREISEYTSESKVLEALIKLGWIK